MSQAKRLNSRVAYGLFIGFIVASAAILGGYFWSALVVLFFPVAYRELYNLMEVKGIHPSKFTVWFFGLSFYIFAILGWERHFQILVTLGVIFTFSWLLFRKSRATISDIGGTIMMFFYLGLLPAHFILLRDIGAEPTSAFWQQPGLRYLFLILFTVSASDIFAYYGGKRWGKNLLSPEISPKKTIEGAGVGLLLAVIIGSVAAYLLGIAWIHGMVLGAIISIIAQLGDLSESLLKRDAGIKDSGTLIPGHGGILDRTDSYIFSGAIGYYYINWFILHQGIAKEFLHMLGSPP